MAFNPVQFPKGFSLNEFLQHYGTEGQCLVSPETMAMAQWIPVPSLWP